MIRKALTMAALALALAGLPAAAQEADGMEQPQQGAGQAIPPSAAVKLAMQAMPGAKPLGVSLRRGIYVVRLKQDGSIIQVGVDPASGEVFPLN